MQLEQWIQKDMTHFIKEHEPELHKDSTIREEDGGTVGKIDYEKRITQALKQHRFADATSLFNDLKKQFINTPKEYLEHRKQYYRIMQRCYKQIYEYVEDRHKTSRLLSRLDDSADVFNQQVQPVNLKEQEQTQTMMPSIEELMFRKQQHQPPSPQQTENIQLPTPPEETEPTVKQLLTQAKQSTTNTKNESADKQEDIGWDAPKFTKLKHKQAEDISLPEFPDLEKKTNTTPQQKPETKPITNTTNDKPPVKVTPHPDDKYAPPWKPPEMNFTTREHKQKPDTKPSLNKPSQKTSQTHPERVQATNQLIKDTLQAIQEENYQLAQNKLIEARFEYLRTQQNHPEQLRAIEKAERELAAKKDVPTYAQPIDKELFSTLYIQGVHALKKGDYNKAAHCFYKRMNQAPYDIAARIRYQETQEVLHGKTA